MNPETLGRDLATLFEHGAPPVTLAELEEHSPTSKRAVANRRPLVALAGAFAVVLLGGLTIGLLTQPGEQPPSTIPPVVDPSTTTTTTTSSTTTEPTGTTSEPTRTHIDRSGPFAVIFADRVELFRGETHDVLDIPGVRSGVVRDDRFVFGLEGSSGVWTWPTGEGTEMVVPGGTEPVRLLVGQTGTETSAWFQDAASIDGRELVLFREIESETDPIEERMMILDLVDGSTSLVFDKTTRRDDLGYEEVVLAFIGDAALTDDGVVALFGIGDSTWIERYDLTGIRLPELELPAGVEGTVLELDAAGHLLAVGVERELNQGIVEVWIVDLDTGELDGPYAHDVDGESLHDLTFDGETIAAGIRTPGGTLVGAWVYDGSEIYTSTDPVFFALP